MGLFVEQSHHAIAERTHPAAVEPVSDSVYWGRKLPQLVVYVASQIWTRMTRTEAHAVPDAVLRVGYVHMESSLECPPLSPIVPSWPPIVPQGQLWPKNAARV